MSGCRASCPLCGWKKVFAHPGRARREQGAHRCDPHAVRTGPRPPRRRAGHRAILAAVLTAAADSASRESSALRAVDKAWAILNADTGQALTALRAWARSERYHADVRGLGGMLRGRYQTAAQVAGSLRAAAGLLDARRRGAHRPAA